MRHLDSSFEGDAFQKVKNRSGSVTPAYCGLISSVPASSPLRFPPDRFRGADPYGALPWAERPTRLRH